jgi:hypothetical protein
MDEIAGITVKHDRNLKPNCTEIDQYYIYVQAARFQAGIPLQAGAGEHAPIG